MRLCASGVGVRSARHAAAAHVCAAAVSARGRSHRSLPRLIQHRFSREEEHAWKHLPPHSRALELVLGATNGGYTDASRGDALAVTFSGYI